jgi:cyclic pyranopterin phosphate synthase
MQARIFVAEGVTKVRLTGGEPTVRGDLADIACQLSALPGLQTLAMTTNGLVLERHLPALRRAGLSALNISLDTLKPDRFEQLTRHRGHERVLSSIHAAVAKGFSVKVNVVVMRGVNDDELLEFVDMTRDLPINVRFIEYMPFDDNAWSQRKLVRIHLVMKVLHENFHSLMRSS